MTLDHVGRFYERVLSRKAELQNETAPAGPLVEELVGGVYAEKAKLLAQRTGELHLALASVRDDPVFAPEPFNAMAQRSVYQSMRALLRRNFDSLKKKLPDVPENLRDEAKEVLGTERKSLLAKNVCSIAKRTPPKSGSMAIITSARSSPPEKISSFSISEGEPARPLSERKLKRSALRDVAGMMRSFQYAAYSALWQPGHARRRRSVSRALGRSLVSPDEQRLSAKYLQTTPGATFVPQNSDDLQILLEAYLLDKAVYEIGYELNNRPDWVIIPSAASNTF